jgi:NAD(P)-dependent dehydrogenase (short-subunit alcohol dehydrogenase family)
MAFHPAENQVALITGAALGIGRAAAKRFAENGLKVVMVDLPGEDLDKAIAEVQEISEKPDNILAIAADVSDENDIDRVAENTVSAFGVPHILMNNAASRVGRGFDAPLAEWRRIMDVNFWGVVMLTRALLPEMLASAEPGLVINVGSKQGITNPPGHPIYNVTKSALKTYTEALEHDLRSNHARGNVTAHLLVPGWTTTGKAEHKAGAWKPEQVIDYMLDALARGSFYIICPDDEVTTEMDNKRIRWGAEDITEDRPPLSRWHPEFKTTAAKACS